MEGICADRVYTNAGNPAVVDLVDRDSVTVLDVGCGAGDTAALLRARDPWKRIHGITMSAAEADRALRHTEKCWIADLETAIPEDLGHTYDVIIAAHVLEHMRDPSTVLCRLVERLRPGGACIIAVPNVLFWAQRLLFLAGRFEYKETGVLDETHLRFFSYETADRFLLSKTPTLRVSDRRVTASVPLWLLRRHLFSPRFSTRIDALAGRLWPNLFGGEILIKAIKER